MAAPRRRRLLRGNSSVLVSVRVHKVGHLVYRFDVKRLFSDDDDDDESSRRKPPRPPREVLPLPPSHVACFSRPLGYPMELAASPGGDKIVAATTDGHIVVYDAARSQYTNDHDLLCWKRWPILLASRSSSSSSRPSSSGHRRRRRDDDMSMVVVSARPELMGKPDEPYMEALRLTSGGRLQPLPVPPPLPVVPAKSWTYGCSTQVTCFFVAGGRAWLSLSATGGREARRGTYSLDMAAPKLGWRQEGSWVLPLEGRAVYAPDLGLLLGLTPGGLALCVVDMEARPPVIRQQWTRATNLLPTKDEGYSLEEDYFYFGALAYLGGGRLCISWSSPYREQGRRTLALTAVELTTTAGGNSKPPLMLRKHRSRCYRLPPDNQKAIVLPLLL